MPENPAKIANAMYIQPSPSWMLGQQYAHRSIVLGLFSLIFLGFLLGPAAVRQARKAEALNVVAVFGRTLGMVGTFLGICTTVMVIYNLFAPDSVRTWLAGMTGLFSFLLPW